MTDRSGAIRQREDGATHRDPLTIRDGDVPQLASVVPDGRDLDDLASEGPMNQLEKAALPGYFVAQYVVLGRRLLPEEVSRSLIGEQAMPIRCEDLQGYRRIGKDPLEKLHGVRHLREASAYFVETMLHAANS